jgi:ribosome-binding protein aMBF1 (putative translation factor)
MPRKLALRASEAAVSPAKGERHMLAGEQKGSQPRSRSTRRASENLHSAEQAKIGFDQSSVTKVTEASMKSRLRRRQIHGSDKPIESQLQRQCFAKNFRAARKDAGLSQRDIQTKTGIPQSHISEIESAMHNICIETMVKLANLVHVPVHELLKP